MSLMVSDEAMHCSTNKIGLQGCGSPRVNQLAWST